MTSPSAGPRTDDRQDRVRVTYLLTPGPGEAARAKAEDIALEQSVELPAECLRTDEERRLTGRVDAIEALPDGRRWRAVVSYPLELIGTDLLQLVNVLFGNVSLKRGILVEDVEWPESALEGLPGPRHGVVGLRALCRAERRPLLCVALKPVGLATSELAARCSRFAAAGVDIIKDDHGITDQVTAPFKDRVLRCLEAVERANSRTGGSSSYFPNLTGPLEVLQERVAFLDSAGCRGVLVSPLLVGLDTVAWLARASRLAVMSHPALAGAFFGSTHGMDPGLLLGTLFRLAGSDGVIYPNVGGRFSFDDEVCAAINDRLRRPLGGLRPAFPVPGGGIDAARLPEWIDRYGSDTIFLIGASLYAAADWDRAAGRLVDAVRAYEHEADRSPAGSP